MALPPVLPHISHATALIAPPSPLTRVVAQTHRHAPPGAALSVLAAVFMIGLVIAEFNAYLSVSPCTLTSLFRSTHHQQPEAAYLWSGSFGLYKVGRNTLTDRGPVTVTGNGADFLLPPVTRFSEGLF